MAEVALSLARPAVSSVGRRRHLGVNAPQWRNALFIVPFLFFFVTLLVVPLFWGIWLSVHKADTFGVGKFVGLGNYLRLYNDKIFLQSIGNTFYFVALTVPLLAVMGLLLALGLNRKTRTATILRAVYFSSSVLSVTIVTLIWRIVFVPNFGLLTTIYGWFGATAPAFLSNQDLAMIAIAIATIWWCIGLPMMLFLSALQQIPGDIYEAAALDNASRWRVLWYITLPSIRRTFVLVVIIQIVLQFQLFGQSKLLTQGGPNNASKPIVYYIYETAFTKWDLGLGAAASEVLFVLILIAAMAQYLFSRRQGEEG
ncbi:MULTISPECIES: carbohydrate ABC transporter permease [unclassified Rhizobium]|uniref:carbohydrate ABC transporter permease n=1 Tax=unclassified Rhizobium TaxID=2613769 RepID=UPI001ADC1A23|nr:MULTISPECIES: sugar ABC transporter permease [unclassified Rhizobium]MBO9100647.1 sugar ABC transporter permease [Rhizobium sp. L58/93]MBO9135991.1 sugar ABC transporter permease [Rhizobium sp. B209b/85]MBO9171303.1 sugar ABC transporter permease [Rhizobium sp. L245/93]MBO9187170.1 sugar ABC transporter permease [Rhizobium sp. E27B/91]QXZ87859.1 sugar ABC transporter permease [Rhizobium sp. K1/93]